ncbi:hypothetical protein RISK_004230 [Rhodopirellula islandica]|uniref:Uncharacterized protein n=1 Tax=Rhodopirellula islandica TaxID=595434 RepID=A0A0J1BBA2_RHOIS|nr:hypothetical protein RISK_004230 [Rhodopirellula islandica]
MRATFPVAILPPKLAATALGIWVAPLVAIVLASDVPAFFIAASGILV